VKNIEFLADPTAGELRIGSTAFLATSFVSAVVGRLSPRYPRIVFHLMTGTAEMLQRDLRERKVDLVITRSFGRITDEHLHSEFLFDDSFSVAASAQSQWARRRSLELADLIKEPWVLPPPESAIWSVAMESFRRSGLDFPRATVVAVLPEIRISMLATMRFLSIFPTSALKFSIRRPEVAILPVRLPVPHVPIELVTLKNRTLSPVAQLFCEHARDVAKPLVQPSGSFDSARSGGI
jgi:DNA-binding transcriptional LysR family regulator